MVLWLLWLIFEVLDWLTRTTFIYKRKAVATAPFNFLGEGPHDMYLRRPHHNSWMKQERFSDFIPSRLASPKVNTDNSQIKFICNLKNIKRRPCWYPGRSGVSVRRPNVIDNYTGQSGVLLSSVIINFRFTLDGPVLWCPAYTSILLFTPDLPA